MTAARYRVVIAPSARLDLDRLLDHLLDRAQYAEDTDVALGAVAHLEQEVLIRLGREPHLYRPAQGQAVLHELVVAGPSGGYVALFDIPNAQQVTVLAIRHQLEDDYL